MTYTYADPAMEGDMVDRPQPIRAKFRLNQLSYVFIGGDPGAMHWRAARKRWAAHPWPAYPVCKFYC